MRRKLQPLSSSGALIYLKLRTNNLADLGANPLAWVFNIYKQLVCQCHVIGAVVREVDRVSVALRMLDERVPRHVLYTNPPEIHLMSTIGLYCSVCAGAATGLPVTGAVETSSGTQQHPEPGGVRSRLLGARRMWAAANGVAAQKWGLASAPGPLRDASGRNGRGAGCRSDANGIWEKRHYNLRIGPTKLRQGLWAQAAPQMARMASRPFRLTKIMASPPSGRDPRHPSSIESEPCPLMHISYYNMLLMPSAGRCFRGSRLLFDDDSILGESLGSSMTQMVGTRLLAYDPERSWPEKC